MGIIIRREKENEYRAVENLTRESFWNVYRPGCMEHYVLHCYRTDPDFVPELDLVMEKDGELIGQVIYVRSHIDLAKGGKLPIMTFGPIGIAPAYKRQGYGKMLLDYSMEQARAMGAGLWPLRGTSVFMENPGLCRPAPAGYAMRTQTRQTRWCPTSLSGSWSRAFCWAYPAPIRIRPGILLPGMTRRPLRLLMRSSRPK